MARMKKIIKIILAIPGFKLYFVLFMLAVLLSQGAAIQILPIVDKEVTALVENSLRGQAVNWQSVFFLFMVACLSMLLFQVFQRVSFFIADFLREDVWNYVFKAGFSKVLYHDLEFITRERSSSILNKLSRAADKISNLFTDAASVFLRNAIKALVSLAIIAAISPVISFLILLTVIFYSIIYYIRFRADIPLGKERDKFADKEFSRIWEVVPQIQTTKIFGNEDQEIDNVYQVRNKLKINTIKRSWLWVWAQVAQYPLVNLPTIAIKFYAAWLAITGDFGIPTFVLLYALIGIIQEPLWVINWFMWEMQDTIYRAAKYLDILNSEELVKNPLHPQKISNPASDIIFHDASMSYKNGQKNVLKKININFAGKKVTALVGKSGAGKSTITNLICRFFDPTSGKITLDGVDLKDIHQQDLRHHLGFVMQDAHIFSGTVADNLRYAKHDASNDELIAALKKAQAWEFIKDFKKGLYTQIGERGIKLSGGQRQRLSIARTILKNPSILILDEATNALDSESEMLVQKALEEFMEDRTVIMIAHRLSTVRKADMIYVIDDGQVKEAGNHQQLIKLRGTYKMLHDIQAGGFDKVKKIMEEYELD